MSQFSWPVRVYYEDTDAGGVVYHANYLKFLERARSEWLRSLGYEQDALRDVEGVLFVVRALEIRFVSPARFNEALEVGTRVVRLGGASIDFVQTIRRGEQPVCEALVKIAILDPQSFRPRPAPAHLRERIGELLS